MIQTAAGKCEKMRANPSLGVAIIVCYFLTKDRLVKPIRGPIRWHRSKSILEDLHLEYAIVRILKKANETADDRHWKKKVEKIRKYRLRLNDVFRNLNL